MVSGSEAKKRARLEPGLSPLQHQMSNSQNNMPGKAWESLEQPGRAQPLIRSKCVAA